MNKDDVDGLGKSIAEPELNSKGTAEQEELIDRLADSLRAQDFKKVDRAISLGGPGCSACRTRITTEPGYVNLNGQRVVRATDLPATDYLRKIYVVHCEHCGIEYGANGPDIHQRRCPQCQGGKRGLAIR